MIKTRGVVHFSIPSTNLDRSKAFYTEVLGMRLIRHVPNMVFLDVGGDCVVLVQVNAPISTANVRDLHHAFMVDHESYRSAVAMLAERGVEVLYEEDRNDGVIDGPRAYFRDPDGNTLEIIDLRFYAGTTAE